MNLVDGPLRCFVCWVTNEQPNTFETMLEVELHRIARHPNNPITPESEIA